MHRKDRDKTQTEKNQEPPGKIDKARRKVAGRIGGAVTGTVLVSSWKTPVVESIVLPAHAQMSPTSPESIRPTVTTDSADGGFVLNFSAAGTVVDEGSAPVTERGFVLSLSPNPTVADNTVMVGSGPGSFSVTDAATGGLSGTVYVRAYAINSVGVAYGNEIVMDVDVCLARGTLVALADGTRKFIEDIDYHDELLVWNFDLGRFDKAKPLYIKLPGVARKYNLLEFSDGACLKTIVQHRIFNKQAGRFTYPMTDETPLGTITFNQHGRETVLVKKQVVTEAVEYYNVITDFHMNLFGNGILTSIGYNNLYPIREMKFVKDNRCLIGPEKYEGIDGRFYHGLRLAEQVDIPIDSTIAYVQRREAIAKPGGGYRHRFSRSMSPAALAGVSSNAELR